jgi:hypothetical protein
MGNKIEIIKPDHYHGLKPKKKKRNAILRFILVTGEFLVWLSKGIIKVFGTLGKGLANTDLMTGRPVNNNKPKNKPANKNYQQQSMFGNLGAGSIVGESFLSSKPIEPKKKKPRKKVTVTEYFEE